MADTVTVNFGLTLPEVGGSDDAWGDKMNANLVKLDAEVFEAQQAVGGAFPNYIQGPVATSGRITFNRDLTATAFDTPILDFHGSNNGTAYSYQFYTAAGVLQTKLSSDWIIAMAGSPNLNVRIFSGAVTASSFVAATAFQTTSDERLKSAIERLDGAESLQALTAIGAHRYLKGERREAGVLAQRVEQAGLGYLVSHDAEGIRSVNYNGLIAVLIAAVVHLSDRLDAIAPAE